MPTSTVEDYLKAIYTEHERAGKDRVTTGEVAAALGVSPGTATSMVKTLGGSGLVDYEPYAGVRLTDAGRQLATRVLRRHRLIELFLVRVLGMNWSEVHDEAEHLEHAASERLIERLDEMLGFPAVDPHGDPIPDADGVVRERRLPSLLDCPLGEPVRVARVSDQDAEFLRRVEAWELLPGARLTVEERDEAADSLRVRLAGGRRHGFGFRAGAKILVEPVPTRTGS